MQTIYSRRAICAPPACECICAAPPHTNSHDSGAREQNCARQQPLNLVAYLIYTFSPVVYELSALCTPVRSYTAEHVFNFHTRRSAYRVIHQTHVWEPAARPHSIDISQNLLTPSFLLCLCRNEWNPCHVRCGVLPISSRLKNANSHSIECCFSTANIHQLLCIYVFPWNCLFYPQTFELDTVDSL